jgi:hypothetical protein
MPGWSVRSNEAEPLLNSHEPFASSSHASYATLDITQPRTLAPTGEGRLPGPEDKECSESSVQYGDSECSRSMSEQLGDDGLSLYEKKCILINREIDLMGMGRYQWSLWALCGCGYLIDLMWAQAFGLFLSPLQQELGFGPDQTGKLSTAWYLSRRVSLTGVH